MLRNLGLKAALLALLATPVIVFSTGCNPECVDKFDCYSKVTAAQQNWTCVDSKCVVGSPDPDVTGAADAGP
jgi:hypothetical protein